MSFKSAEVAELASDNYESVSWVKGLCYTIARGERWYNIGQRRHTFSSECVLEQIILIRSLKRNQSIRISCPVDQLVVNAPSAADNLPKQRKNYTEASCFVDSRVTAPHSSKRESVYHVERFMLREKHKNTTEKETELRCSFVTAAAEFLGDDRY